MMGCRTLAAPPCPVKLKCAGSLRPKRLGRCFDETQTPLSEIGETSMEAAEQAA